jgi:hypothetical protein
MHAKCYILIMHKRAYINYLSFCFLEYLFNVTSGVNYTTREASSRGGWFGEVGWGFHNLLACSEVLLALR